MNLCWKNVQDYEAVIVEQGLSSLPKRRKVGGRKFSGTKGRGGKKWEEILSTDLHLPAELALSKVLPSRPDNKSCPSSEFVAAPIDHRLAATDLIQRGFLFFFYFCRKIRRRLSSPTSSGCIRWHRFLRLLELYCWSRPVKSLPSSGAPMPRPILLPWTGETPESCCFGRLPGSLAHEKCWDQPYHRHGGAPPCSLRVLLRCLAKA